MGIFPANLIQNVKQHICLARKEARQEVALTFLYGMCEGNFTHPGFKIYFQICPFLWFYGFGLKPKQSSIDAQGSTLNLAQTSSTQAAKGAQEATSSFGFRKGTRRWPLRCFQLRTFVWRLDDPWTLVKPVGLDRRLGPPKRECRPQDIEADHPAWYYMSKARLE